MPSIYTIEGTSRRRRRRKGKRAGRSSRFAAPGCLRVRHGKKRGCTIAICEDSRGRKRFKKGSVRCGG